MSVADIQNSGSHLSVIEKLLQFFNALVSSIQRIGLASASFFKDPYTVIVPGNQEQATGPVHLNQVQQTCAHLKTLAQDGVDFNPSRISRELTGGTCSSMTLNFAATYIHYSTVVGEVNANNLDPLQMMVPQSSSLTHRIHQAAFNTIERSSTPQNCTDFKRAKIESLLNYFDLTSLCASEDVDLNHPQSLQTLTGIFNALPVGCFVIRAILPEDNHKEETHGHSTLLIKEKDNLCLFYDPNRGLCRLNTGYEAQCLHDFLYNDNKYFGVSSVRLYTVQSSLSTGTIVTPPI